VISLFLSSLSFLSVPYEPVFGAYYVGPTRIIAKFDDYAPHERPGIITMHRSIDVRGIPLKTEVASAGKFLNISRLDVASMKWTRLACINFDGSMNEDGVFGVVPVDSNRYDKISDLFFFFDVCLFMTSPLSSITENWLFSLPSRR